MQATMAARVAGALGRVLGRGEEDLLAERPTANTEAYQLYLQAKAIQDNGAVAQRRAASLLEQAVALDANFAEAWALMANAWGRVYANGQRDVESGRRAREAADRARALKPNAAATHIAMARYHSLVAVDVPRAIAEMERALEAEPNNPEAVATMGNLLVSYGEAARARSYVERARTLDPRSQVVSSVRLRVLLQLEEYEAAKTAGHEAIALGADDIQAIQDLALAYAGTNDLAGARAMLREAMQQVPSTQLVAYFTGYNETGWLLEEADQQLAFRLTPSSFDDDVSWWGQALAILAWGRGEEEQAREYARQSREPSRVLVEANPEDGQLRVLYAIVLAYLGEHEAAQREAREGVRLTETAGGQVWFNTQYERLQLVRVLIVVGRHDEAITTLEQMREHRYPYIGALRHDPMFTPIRNHPRFQALAR
jgi:tetratricopeptide (TPR) repeat protein